MKKLDFRRWFLFLCTGLFSVLTFAGCTDDKEQDYLYSIGITQYQHTGIGSGAGMLEPLTYLSSLNIAENFTVTSESRKEADAEAVARFNQEMGKIDAERISAFEPIFIEYALTSIDGSTIATRSFGTKE